MNQYYSRVCGYKLSFEPWNDKFDQRTYLKYCNGAESQQNLLLIEYQRIKYIKECNC